MTIVLPVCTRRVRRQRDSSVPADVPPPTPDRVPRVARMLALAHHWRGLIRDGVVNDQAALSRLLGVSRARVTQVMDLLYLAPDIQEEILFLAPAPVGCTPIRHRDVPRVTADPSWEGQRSRWRGLVVGPRSRGTPPRTV